MPGQMRGVYGEVGKAIVAGNIIGNFFTTRKRPRIGEMEPIEHGTIRQAQVDFTSDIGVGNTRMEYLRPLLRAAGSEVEKSQWVSSEEDATLKAVLYGAELIAKTNLQVRDNMLFPLIAESDAKAAGYNLFAQGSLDTLLMAIQNKKIVVPKLCINLARLFTVWWMTSKPFENKGYPAAFYCPWVNETALADLYTLAANVEAQKKYMVRHMAKLGLPVKQLTVSDLMQNHTEINPISSTGLFYKYNTPFILDSADTQCFYSAWKVDEAIVAGAHDDEGPFADGSTLPDIYWEGDAPHELNGAARMMYQFKAGNNDFGCTVLDDPATNKIGYWTVKPDGTVAAMATGSQQPLVAQNYAVQKQSYLYSSVLASIVNGAHGVSTSEYLNSARETWVRDGLSSQFWDDVPQAFLIKYMLTDLSLRGGKVGGN